ncbi:MAG TPA: type I restriction-modification system subunit M N-terminal domain-containing protein [Vicinamibacterales bacterium]|nr:type I restriction-modification system subunit M N-terminal domain-containing protein [Vicinamibacterales bacterium]
MRNTVKSIQDIMRQDTGVDGDAQRISQLCWMFFLKIIDDQDQELEILTTDAGRAGAATQSLRLFVPSYRRKYLA